MRTWLAITIACAVAMGCGSGKPEDASELPVKHVPKPAPKVEIWQWGMNGHRTLPNEQVGMKMSFQLMNDTLAEVKSVDVVLTMRDAPTQKVTYSSQPFRVASFPNLQHLHVGSLLGWNKTSFIEHEFVVPSRAWNSGVYPTVELASTQGFVGKVDLHDPSHFYNFLISNRDEAVMADLKKDPSLLQVKSSLGLNSAAMALTTVTSKVVEYVESQGTKLELPADSPRGLMDLAVRSGHPENLELALKRGAKVDEPDIKGMTPLMLAALLGFPREVEWLAKHSANLNAQDKEGLRPIIYALKLGQFGIADQLAALGAETKVYDHKGRGMLHHLAGYLDEVPQLVQKWRLDVNDHAPGSKLTPALYAVSIGRTEFAAQMIVLGADIHAKDDKGRDIFEVAKANSTLHSDLGMRIALRKAGVQGY